MHAFDRHLHTCTNSIRFCGVLENVVAVIFQRVFAQKYIKIIFFKKIIIFYINILKR
jgi:hypothetical protein